MDKNVIKKSIENVPNGGISGKFYKKSNKILEKVS